VHVVLVSLLDEGIDYREIEAPLVGFELTPFHRSEYGIEPHLSEPRPQRGQILRVRRRGIAQFAAQHEVRLAVYNELRGRAVGRQMRNIRSARCCCREH